MTIKHGSGFVVTTLGWGVRLMALGVALNFCQKIMQ
jgi:hypothetical protein